MFRTPLIAAFALVAAAPSLPHAAEPAAAAAPRHAYPAIEQIAWSHGDASYGNGPNDQLRFVLTGEGHLNSSMGPQDAADARAIIASIQRAHPDEDLSFSLAREAGTLACTGRAEDGGRASGTCRFDPAQPFAAELTRRGIAPDDSADMLGLTLVDAHLAEVDGLVAQGFHFGDAGDLIAVSALHITPAYAGELRDAGLKVEELGDLIAAKALKIDAPWLVEMARAGYPDLAAGQAIQMRALGITPEYAGRMGRVLHAVHAVEIE